MDRGKFDIVLIRMDKLGDLVVSLPVDEHPALQGQRVHWLVTQGLSFICEQAAPKRACSEFQRRFSPFEFMRLWRWLRAHSPRTVVLLHNPWWVSIAVWLSGVPERIGRRSQWHSFLALNIPVRQKRSAADRHESDFNFDLVEFGFNKLGVRRTSNLALLKKTFLSLIAPNPFATVAARGLQTGQYRIVHPGMAGSALNWPPENYVQIIEELAREMPVLITGTKMDQKYLIGVEKVKALTGVHWMVDQLRHSELLDLLAQARSVTAPSTGVLHLAAALGTPAVGIYSPRKVEHPRRWGPKGPHTTYLVPEVAEGEMFHPDVMREILPAQVLAALRQLERPPTRADAQPSV